MAGIYIHIPYCRQKCNYCNFFSQVSVKTMDAFLEALHQENYNKRSYLQGESIETLYFGGGTPSLLPPAQIEAIINEIRKYYSVVPSPEITLEANPDDINDEFLTALKKTSVNRLSLGVQSFFEQDLNFLRRSHSGEQAIDSIKAIIKHGYTNFSIDLIYGIPGLSDENFLKNLEYVEQYKVPHLSAYALTVEPKTSYQHLIRKAKKSAPDEATTIRHLKLLMQWAELHDYEFYEISNLAKPNYRSKHNSSYWLGKKYLGLGPSAHSFNITSRQWNVANTAKYIQSVNEQIDYFEMEYLSGDEQFNEFLLTRIRTIEGIAIKEVEAAFGRARAEALLNQAKPYLISGQLLNETGSIKLSKTGVPIADQITADLFC